MKNFLYRVSSAMARFMYGRNGSDQLGSAMLVLYLILIIIQPLFRRVAAVHLILEFLSLALAAAVLFRIFSRNLNKRRAENARFLSWWSPVKNRITGIRRRSQDKEHKYFTCKNCKTICRVPAGKGKIEITCPKCGEKIIGKS